jgi:glutamyl-tRNA reductase
VFAELNVNGDDFDAVITAISVSQPVITTDSTSRLRTPLYFDLGAAPNVDPAVDRLPRKRVIRLEELGAGTDRSGAVHAAELMVRDELARFLSQRAGWWIGARPASAAEARQRVS